MFKHLLVPLDGTPKAEQAVAVAAVLAGRTGAKITLLHVIESDAPGTVHGLPHLRSAEEAEAYLKRIAAEKFPQGVSVGLHVHKEKIEDVAGSLAEHAAELRPDLLVMCVHGGPRIRDMLFGNLAQQTLSRGEIPVLMVKTCPPEYLFRSVLAPLDGRPEHDERGLPVAAGMAGLYSAALRLLYVVPDSIRIAGNKAVPSRLLPGTHRAILDIEQEEAVAYLERRLETIRSREIEASGAIARGEPVDRIADFAEQEKVDLLVLATHGRAGTHAFWSASVASRLISRLELSFLLVPAPR